MKQKPQAIYDDAAFYQYLGARMAGIVMQNERATLDVPLAREAFAEGWRMCAEQLNIKSKPKAKRDGPKREWPSCPRCFAKHEGSQGWTRRLQLRCGAGVRSE